MACSAFEELIHDKFAFERARCGQELWIAIIPFKGTYCVSRGDRVVEGPPVDDFRTLMIPVAAGSSNERVVPEGTPGSAVSGDGSCCPWGWRSLLEGEG
jgi:hypothetical protein